MLSFRRHNSFAMLFSVIALSLGGLVVGQTEKTTKQADSDQVREFEDLIEALANTRNKAPKIVRRGPEGFPIFEEDYDAAEQRRVKKVLRDLNSRVGDELWPVLVKHIDDKRYAMTFDADSRAENETVGSLCSKMAGDLWLPFTRCMPQEDRGNNYRLYAKSEWWPHGGLAEWADKGKRLHKLQIDICELARQAAPTMKELSADERNKFVLDLADQIEQIKKTGQPIVITSRFRGDYHATYDANQVRRHREEYEKNPQRYKSER